MLSSDNLSVCGQVGGRWGEEASGIMERNDIGFLIWSNTKVLFYFNTLY